MKHIIGIYLIVLLFSCNSINDREKRGDNKKAEYNRIVTSVKHFYQRANLSGRYTDSSILLIESLLGNSIELNTVDLFDIKITKLNEKNKSILLNINNIPVNLDYVKADDSFLLKLNTESIHNLVTISEDYNIKVIDNSLMEGSNSGADFILKLIDKIVDDSLQCEKLVKYYNSIDHYNSDSLLKYNRILFTKGKVSAGGQMRKLIFKTTNSRDSVINYFENEFEINNNLSALYFLIDLYDKTNSIFLGGVDESKKNKYVKILAWNEDASGMRQLADYYCGKSQLDSCLYYQEKNCKIHNKCIDYYRKLAIVDFEKAKSKLLDLIQEEDMISEVNFALGEIYLTKFGKCEEAIHYLTLSCNLGNVGAALLLMDIDESCI
ncbi:MAG: hypothetical protein ACI9N1_002943 [Flavobacteriales bacterium]|jgi:hypothetical protein